MLLIDNGTYHALTPEYLRAINALDIWVIVMSRGINGVRRLYTLGTAENTRTLEEV